MGNSPRVCDNLLIFLLLVTLVKQRPVDIEADNDDLEEAGLVVGSNSSINRLQLVDFGEASIAKYKALFLGI